MNRDLARAVGKRDQRRLAMSAHEIGHALGTEPYDIPTRSVRLRFGMLGGLIGGLCVWDNNELTSWPHEKQVGHLVGLMAGHAAEIRFCRLYLELDDEAAYRYGREWAEGDYLNFRYYRSKLGLRRYSQDWAFEQATTVINRQADRLDRLTLRLDRAKQLTGSQL